MISIGGSQKDLAITIRLETSLTDEALRDADGAELSVPERMGRKGLRELLKLLLKLDPSSPPPEFHFLIGEKRERLRTTLGSFCAKRGISTEKLLKVEYFLPAPAPEQRTLQSASDDWVGCVDARPGVEGGWKVVLGDLQGGCGVITASEKTWSAADSRHGGGVKGVCWVEGSNNLFVSASQDETVGVWRWVEETGEGRKVGDFSSDEIGEGTSFECVTTMSLSREKWLAVVGGFNGTLWSVDFSEFADRSEENALGKRTGSDVKSVTGRKLDPTHEGICLSSLCFRGGELLSSSWDGLVRVWDFERGSVVRTIPGGGKALTGLAVSGQRLAVSAVDGLIRLVDTNLKGIGGGSAVVAKSGRLRSHKGLVSSVVWIGEGHELASAGHDGSLRVWDIRSISAPLRVIEAVHGVDGKCLSLACITHGDKKLLFSGGSDSNVRQFSFG